MLTLTSAWLIDSVLEASCDTLSAHHCAEDASRAGSDTLLCDAPVGRSPRVSVGYTRKGFRSFRMDGRTGEGLACGRAVANVGHPADQKGTDTFVGLFSICFKSAGHRIALSSISS